MTYHDRDRLFEAASDMLAAIARVHSPRCDLHDAVTAFNAAVMPLLTAAFDCGVDLPSLWAVDAALTCYADGKADDLPDLGALSATIKEKCHVG